MRVATGAVMGLGPEPSDANDVPLPSATLAELDKARNLKLSGFWRGMATINGKARALGTAEVFEGDYRKAFAEPAAFEAVTAAQVQALAAKILRTQNRTTGLLKPVAAPAAKKAPAANNEEGAR